MKKFFSITKQILLPALLLMPVIMSGQENVTVLVKVIENGKTITDTAYSYKNVKDAEKALQLMDITNKEDLYFDLKELKGPGTHKILITSNTETQIQDGKKEITRTITEDAENGDSLKTMVIKTDAQCKARAIIVKKDGNTESYNILLDDEKGNAEDENKEGQGSYKVIMVKPDGEQEIITKMNVIGDDDDMEWTVTDDQGKKVEKKIIIIKGDKESVDDPACCEKQEKMKTEQEVKVQVNKDTEKKDKQKKNR